MQADFEHFIARISESIDATLPVMISKAKAIVTNIYNNFIFRQIEGSVRI